jgi:ribosomal protein S8
MRTVYIKGIKKYKVSLLKGLNKSGFIEGKDYIRGVDDDDYALYWLANHVTLKHFKLVIDAHYVWKHRMRFYNSYDEMLTKKKVKKFMNLS